MARWTLPTNLGVPIFNGGSFFGEFMSSIGRNLGRFPNGPPLNDPFWYVDSWNQNASCCCMAPVMTSFTPTLFHYLFDLRHMHLHEQPRQDCVNLQVSDLNKSVESAAVSTLCMFSQHI